MERAAARRHPEALPGGATPWVGLWTILAHLVGSRITTVYDDVTRYRLYVLVAAYSLLAALVVGRLVRRPRDR